ncbi:MAG: group I intron-associated PD-(D/E)XK endonuclease [Acidimicrobiia bacterium]
MTRSVHLSYGGGSAQSVPTKDKGDLGVAHAIADLAEQGFVVLTALCEHAPFDLVGCRDGTFVRVQVKYRALSTSGTIDVQFRSTWSERRSETVRAVGLVASHAESQPSGAKCSPGRRFPCDAGLSRLAPSQYHVELGCCGRRPRRASTGPR